MRKSTWTDAIVSLLIELRSNVARHTKIVAMEIGRSRPVA